MALFKGPSVSSLSKKSQRIFNIFTETQKQLENVNSEIDSHLADKVSQKQKLEQDIDELTGLRRSNSNLHGKITTFLAPVADVVAAPGDSATK